ncbi:bifunctional ornithine acetyltransferase/N-acetylglutamate synthase [Phaeobacter gallaeciensis]|uniref:Arginine biosynthesis bifunctional protein ArgJ n=2 Tax=Roseobacteraceae TaxID=2854170 RepID=A0A366WVM4_9RHOB|nr:bifunctional glutamate N-acetyltransferase/amino-acid acetyltransferase ArgJ [Phaeobacter gallaeciensis]MBT3142182.1 bifunctional glutamate N-acetyltransferase/amino-acid acetyltransferase ArgJ [Falsiruegeria litorea]MBT8168473.1 bifunctional glutamate N-acetyltransferase/amino-acid acetyltransferase ArgJ [Falsiruegeria litorea]RBW54040.1 bifunctional ornithine acetyltransferase/N-acetylglutamate synthase [Phaeobacter gallaeciensis]
MANITKISPLAPAHFPQLPVIAGVRFATAAAGVKYQGRTDVMLAVLDSGTTVAGTFTRSATRSAPVLDCQAKIGGASDGPAAILVNSGNSNAFTGHYGQTSVATLTQSVSDITGVSTDRVFTSSTGVIGEPLPHDRIIAQLEDLNGALSTESVEAAAHAIMTTDTFAKGASAQVEINGKTVSIAGIAKGSGMIAPDMATMLVYIFTDAKVDQTSLQQSVSGLTDTTFNCITVDSDTSTSDTLLVCATGASGADASGNAAFTQALNEVMLDLAQQVVRDGEGATKFVEIRVTGAASDADAKVHGLAIANSPLVKTAIAGEDANWGRVVMAIGKSGAAADRDLLSISFGDILVAEKGWVSPSYSEDEAAVYMKAQDLVIAVDLGLGAGSSTVWTCDLTHGYIEINADYRS